MGIERKGYFAGLLFPRWPGFSGGEIRDYYLLRTLLAWGKVRGAWLFANRDARLSWEGRIERIRFARRSSDLRLAFWWHWSRLLGKIWAHRWPLLMPWPQEVVYYAARWRATLLAQVAHDLVHFSPDLFLVSPQVNPLPLLLQDVRKETTRWVLSTFDVEAERLRRLSLSYQGWGRWVARWDAKRAQSYEQAMIRQVDGIIAVSERDRAFFIEKYGMPAERVWVAANGVDVTYFDFQPPPGPKPLVVLFVGTLAYPPNHMAALRLVRWIMPRVRRVLPQTQLWLVGRSPRPALLHALGPNDYVFANVPDVRTYYRRAQVVCIPLETGSGTKLKVLEALSVGRIVVATSVALEGLTLKPGEHLFVENQDEGLVDRLVEVLRFPQKWEEMRRRARRWVERHYAWEVTMAGLDEWFDALLQWPLRRITA